jgi:hypothetical protein
LLFATIVLLASATTTLQLSEKQKVVQSWRQRNGLGSKLNKHYWVLKGVMMEMVKLNGSKFWVSEWWQLQQEANLGKQRIKKHIISL